MSHVALVCPVKLRDSIEHLTFCDWTVVPVEHISLLARRKSQTHVDRPINISAAAALHNNHEHTAA